MAEPPPYTYKGKPYSPSPPSNTNVNWPSQYNLTNPYPANVGFRPSAPTFSRDPIYHAPANVYSTYQPPPFSTHQYWPNHVPTPSNTVPPPREGVKSYYWVDTSSHGAFPSTALHAGQDIDGCDIYVGRASHESDWIPAKVIPEKNVAYVAYGGCEHAKHHYQVLCEQHFDWIPSSGGHVPPGAVEGGRTSDGEILYIGRVDHDEATTVGKVQPSHHVCYIPFGGKEIGHYSYEILVLRG